MTEMFGEAWSPMSVPDLAPDDDDDKADIKEKKDQRKDSKRHQFTIHKWSYLPFFLMCYRYNVQSSRLLPFF